MAGFADLASLLIDKGANVNAMDTIGHTPLCACSAFKARRLRLTFPAVFAVQNGNLGVVKLLLSRGADVSVIDKYGLNALDWAERSHWKDEAAIVDALINAGATTSWRKPLTAA